MPQRMFHSIGRRLERLAYRALRQIKGHYIATPQSPGGHVFFSLLKSAEFQLSDRRYTTSRDSYTLTSIYKAAYWLRFGTDPLYKVITEHPVALTSDDHKWPHGTIHDNSSNRKFNLKLYDYFGRRADLAVLDLGCAGGGFVRSVIDDGFLAIGIEGSDVSLRLRSGEWDAVPHHLLTADLTWPFALTSAEGTPLRFHCVTMWEVLEHIPEDRLDVLIENVLKHLEPGGIFVASVAQFRDEDPLSGAVYHVTIKSRDWWLKKFNDQGLVEVAVHPFSASDYVRGSGASIRDWDARDGDGFHLVLTQLLSTIGES